MDSPRRHSWLALLATIALASSLGGCAVLPDNGGSAWLNGAPTTPAFTPEIDAFLTTAAAGASTRLDTSPWGDQILLRVHSLYAAASGRTCRNLELEQAQGSHPALACRTASGHWEPVRVLSHGGLPIFRDPSQGADLHPHFLMEPDARNTWNTEETR